MAALTTDQILDAISSMTVLECSELVKAMEEKFGVSAAAPVAVAAVGGAAVRRPCTAGGCSRNGQDHAGQGACALAGLRVCPRAVHARPSAGGRDGHARISAREGCV